MKVVAPFSFDKNIHDKIGSNECDKFGRSGGDVIEEEEKALTDREDRATFTSCWESEWNDFMSDAMMA